MVLTGLTMTGWPPLLPAASAAAAAASCSASSSLFTSALPVLSLTERIKGGSSGKVTADPLEVAVAAAGSTCAVAGAACAVVAVVVVGLAVLVEVAGVVTGEVRTRASLPPAPPPSVAAILLRCTTAKAKCTPRSSGCVSAASVESNSPVLGLACACVVQGTHYSHTLAQSKDCATTTTRMHWYCQTLGVSTGFLPLQWIYVVYYTPWCVHYEQCACTMYT